MFFLGKSDDISMKRELTVQHTNEETQKPLDENTVLALTDLGFVLERIYRRMRSEGYDIINDQIIHLSTGKVYDPKEHPTKHIY
jgi:hypothetical protein